MSGTTIKGNTYTNVLDAVREYGMIPESMFPFGGNNFDRIPRSNKITREMLAKGKEF